MLYHKIILACAYVYDEGKGAQWDIYGYVSPHATNTHKDTHIYICIYNEMLTTDYMKNISNTYT